MKPFALVSIVMLLLAATAHAEQRQVSVTASDGFALQGSYFEVIPTPDEIAIIGAAVNARVKPLAGRM